MHLSIVRVLQGLRMIMPVTGVLQHKCPKPSEDGSVKTLGLPVRLREIRCREQVLRTQVTTHGLEIFDGNRSPLSDNNLEGTPYGKTQCVQNAFAIVKALIVFIGTTLVSFENRSVITERNRCPLAERTSGLRILIAMK